MQEKEIIKTIKNILKSDYIGDDCAYLEDLGIVISQDSLVEDVHFRKNSITPYQLGYKSIMVNISDICASGGKPLYLTISLSLPKNIDPNFIKEFYQGAKDACNNDIKIVGGDLTSSEGKIYISVCAIGSAKGRNISSRKNAKLGYKVVVCGIHGSSGAGLDLLLNGKSQPQCLIKAHLEPKAQIDFGEQIGLNVKEPYAMMDTSDGLADALSQIAFQSNVAMDINFDCIPHEKDIEKFPNWENYVLFGGEDYGLVAVIPREYNFGTQIGTVKQGHGIDLNINNSVIHFEAEDVENKIFKHFGKL